MPNYPAGPGVRLIAAITAIAWVVQTLFIPLEDTALLAGFVPARFAGEMPGYDVIPRLITPLTATLVHGDMLHLAMNLLTFWFCGKIVERFLGTTGLGLLYVLGAYASAALHLLVNLGQMDPMIGASGAISAVVGAYAMLFSNSKTRNWGPVPAEWVRALWLAAAWIGVQWMIGAAGAASGYSIAIAAHIGGFLMGLVLARPLLARHLA